MLVGEKGSNALPVPTCFGVPVVSLGFGVVGFGVVGFGVVGFGVVALGVVGFGVVGFGVLATSGQTCCVN